MHYHALFKFYELTLFQLYVVLLQMNCFQFLLSFKIIFNTYIRFYFELDDAGSTGQGFTPHVINVATGEVRSIYSLCSLLYTFKGVHAAHEKRH